MAQNYENAIKIDIKLQPKEEVKSELQSILSYIKKDSSIDLDFNTKNLENSLKNLNNIIANLGNAIQNNLDFSKVDTKSLTSNINKAVSSVDFDTLQTSLIEQFTEEAGIKGAEKVNKAFIKTIKQYWSSGEIQNILSDALALNEKNIIDMEKSLTKNIKTDSLEKYVGFLKEINVLTDELKVKGQQVSFRNISLSDDEIKDAKRKFGKMISVDDTKGIGIDNVMGEWSKKASNYGFSLEGGLQEQISELGNIIAQYRNIKKNGVATESLISSDEEEQQINRVTKAYFDLIEALDILDKQKNGIDSGIFNGDKEVQEINKIEQSLGGLSEATKKSLNVDNALSSFSELEKRADEIRNSMDGVAKIKYNLGDDGALSSATISYTDSLGKAVTETMAWKNVTDDAGKTIERVFGTTSVSITDNIEKIKQAQIALKNADYTTAQKESYKILSDLLKEEYTLKTKLIGAEGEYKQALEERLVEVKLLENAQKEDISNNNLTSIKQENDLLEKQAQLQTELNLAKAKNNDDIANKIQKEAEAYKKEQQAVQELIQKQIKLLEIKKQGILAKDSKADTSAIDEAISKYKQLNNISMKDLRNEISYINAELKSASSGADGFMGKIGKALNSVGVYVDAGDIFRTIINGAKDAVEYVVDVENAMIDLTRVVDMSDTQAKSFQESMHKLSVELASSNKDTISTVATFSKLGYTLQEATQLGEITTKYDSAADINDINNSTLSLISTLKAYKLEVGDAQGVTDDINEVTNTYAVTANDLNEILKRSASTMSTFGNSLHQNIALGTVANEIVQDSAKVGNALKSIGARITTNSNALKELEAMGVSIEDMNGNLKSTYQLFQDIAPKIQSMKGEELARVANNLFGKEQMSVALSIVQNIEQLDKVMETLKDTTGSVDKEFSRYLDSTDAKMKQLKENMGGLYSQFINSDMTKGTVDGLNLFVTSITNVISKVGALPTTIATAVASLTIFNSKFREMSTSYQPAILTDFIGKLGGLSTVYKDKAKATQEDIVKQKEHIMTQNETGMALVSSKVKLVQYQTQLGYATIAQNACAIGAKALGVAFNMALGAGIGLVIQGLADFANASEIAKQKNETLLSSIQQTKSDLSTMSELQSKFKSLSKALESGTLTEEQSLQKKSELKDVYDQLIQTCPQLEGALDLENGKYEDNIGLIKQAIELKRQQLKLDTEQYLTNNDVNDKGIQKQIDKIQELQKSIQGFASKALMTDDELMSSGNMTLLGKMLGSGDDRRKYFEQLKNESKQELIDLQNDLQTELSKINSAEKLGIKLGVSEESKNNISQAISDISKILNTESQSLNNNTSSVKLNEEAVKLLKQAQGELQSTGIVTNDTLAKLNEVCPDLGINASNASDMLGEMGDSLDGLGDSANDAQSDLEELAKSFNSLSSTNSAIDSVIEDLQKLGGITESTYGKIIDNPEILKALSAEGDTIANLTALQEANREAMQERIQQAVNTANGVSSAQQTEADSKINSDNQKMQSDTNVNNQIRQNATDTTNSNGENYATDDGNFSTIQTSKAQNDASFHDNWRKNTEDSVNELGDMYQLDFANFDNATQAKNALLGQFQQNLEKMGGVFAGASTGLNRMANAITAPWNQATGISEGLAESMDSLFGTDSLNALNQYKDGLVEIGAMFDSAGNKKIDTTKVNTPEIKKAYSTPAMVKGSTSSGSGGSKGSSGKSDAQKAQEEAEKYAEKIKELQSNIDIDRYFDLNQALESINNEMTALKTEQAELMGADYQNSLIREIGLLESKKSALADINDEQKREAEELKNYLSQYGFYFDANGKLINSQQRLLEIQKATNAMGGNTEEELNKKQEWVDWVKELQEKTEQYVNLVNSEIPDVTNQWNELGNTIKEVQLSMIESVRDKLVDAIKKDAEEEVKKLKQEVEDAQEDAKKALEEEKEAKVNVLDTRIEKLKKELASLDDEETDKRAKLVKLKEELAKWQKDDSVFADKKVKDLQEQIAQLEKEIKKDDINNEIDEIEEEKQETEDYYEEKLDKLEEQQKAELEEKQKTWDTMLSEQEAYNKADLLLKQKNMTEITRLLSSYSEDFKDIGSLLGTNFAEALNQEIKSAMDSLDAILGSRDNISNGTTSTGGSSNSSSSSSGKEYVWVEDGANTQLYTDSTGTKSKGSLWSNGVASADKLVKGSYANGFYEVFDQNGNSLGWVDRTKVNKWNDISAFASGGRTPSNIDNGALSILHSGEAILNANDTKKLDDIYDFVTVSASLLDRLEGYVALSNKVHEATMPSPDYNRILGGDNTTNNNNSKTVTIENEINITNNTKNDSYFNARSLEKMFKQQINKFA